MHTAPLPCRKIGAALLLRAKYDDDKVLAFGSAAGLISDDVSFVKKNIKLTYGGLFAASVKRNDITGSVHCDTLVALIVLEGLGVANLKRSTKVTGCVGKCGGGADDVTLEAAVCG